MLRAVRIVRPVEEDELLLLLLVVRQQHFRDDVAIVFLLVDVVRLAGRFGAVRASGGVHERLEGGG